MYKKLLIVLFIALLSFPLQSLADEIEEPIYYLFKGSSVHYEEVELEIGDEIKVDYTAPNQWNAGRLHINEVRSDNDNHQSGRYIVTQRITQEHLNNSPYLIIGDGGYSGASSYPVYTVTVNGVQIDPAESDEVEEESDPELIDPDPNNLMGYRIGAGITGTPTVTEMTDYNLGTHSNIDYADFAFEGVINLEGIRFTFDNPEGHSTALRFRLMKDGDVIFNQGVGASRSGDLLSVNFQGEIDTIRIYNPSNGVYNLQQVEAFGTFEGSTPESFDPEKPEPKPDPEPEPQIDIFNVQVQSTFERVDLSWNLPNAGGFSHVGIYRRTIENNSRNSFLFSTRAYAEEQYDPIFETNGTYFNDLTVEPSTTYEYKLTSVYDSGEESSGVTVTTTTGDEPPPQMGGVEVEEDEDGNYTYSWSSPTEGQVRIVVGGEDYRTVPASDGSITIPASDMAFNAMGTPDVRLVPITPNGTEGGATNPNNSFNDLTLPFNGSDVLNSGVSLLTILVPLVLLSIVIYLVRVKLIPLIRKATLNKNKVAGTRRTN